MAPQATHLQGALALQALLVHCPRWDHTHTIECGTHAMHLTHNSLHTRECGTRATHLTPSASRILPYTNLVASAWSGLRSKVTCACACVRCGFFPRLEQAGQAEDEVGNMSNRARAGKMAWAAWVL